jgi:hypothetical protein
MTRIAGRTGDDPDLFNGWNLASTIGSSIFAAGLLNRKSPY